MKLDFFWGIRFSCVHFVNNDKALLVIISHSEVMCIFCDGKYFNVKFGREIYFGRIFRGKQKFGQIDLRKQIVTSSNPIKLDYLATVDISIKPKSSKNLEKLLKKQNTVKVALETIYIIIP